MYTVKILSEKEFDGLPYKHAKTSLGLADPKSGVAYVRDTGYNDITKGTIDHELDELIAKVSPHEEDGIRYKNLASLGGGAGAGLLSQMVPALQPFSPLISAGVGAAVNKDKDYLRGALQGFTGGGLASGVGGGVFDAFKGIREPGGTFGKALDSFMPGVERGLLQYGGAIPGMKGIGTDAPEGRIAKWLQGGGAAPTTTATGAGSAGVLKAATKGGGGTSSVVPTPGQINANMLADRLSGKTGADTSILQGLASRVGSGGGTGALAPASAGTTELVKKVTDKFSLSDSLKKMIGPVAIAGAGDLFAPKAESPDFSGILGDLRSRAAAGGEPIAKDLGITELTRGLTSPLGTPPMNAFDLGDMENEEAKTKALQNYVNHFKSIRPGADFQNDPQFQRGYAEIEERYDRTRQAQRDEKTFEYNQQQLQQKYNYMAQALALNESQMNQYVNLAQLEVSQLMMEYGVDVETANQFKQMFSDLAQLQYQGGTPKGITLDDLFNRAQA
jgi:hypothetical protein